MDELEVRVRELRDLLYAGRNVDFNFTILCELMRPKIMYRAMPYIRDMAGYDLDDFYQEACIVIWNIMLKKKPDIHTTVVGYLSAAVYYKFANLFYEYALNNVKRLYTGSDFEMECIGYYRVKEFDYVKRRQERDRIASAKAYRKRYIRLHGYPPEEKPEMSVILQLPGTQKILTEEDRELKRFIARTRYQLDSKGIIRTVPLSARYGITEKGEPEIVLTKGRGGKLPLGATMSPEEYLEYLKKQFPRLEKLSKREVVLIDERRKRDAETKHNYYMSHKDEFHRKAVAYYAAHKEENRIKCHEYYLAHQDKLKEYAKEYHAKHRGEENAKKRVYRREHLEEIKESKKAYYEANKEMINEARRKWRKEHSEEYRQKGREDYANNREKHLARSRVYYEKNHEERLRYAKEYRAKKREEALAAERYRQGDIDELAKTDPTAAAEREARVTLMRERERETRRKYREKHKDEINEKKRRWRIEHRDEINAQRRLKRAGQNNKSGNQEYNEKTGFAY